jgi:16S rRNA (guanine1207-N2)-methyltransferase
VGFAPRLRLALDAGGLHLPEAGRVAVFAPRAGDDLSALPEGLVHVVTGFRPDFDHFAGLGYDCAVVPEGRYAAAVVRLPRARARAQALVAQAVQVTDGPVVVDGAKEDGVEALLRACRARVAVHGPVSKAHGKLFWFEAAPVFDDWQAPAPREIAGGFVTAPGVFSADGIDPGSALLAEALPAKLGARVADLGGGWGYLSARVLERAEVARLHLVEADHTALDCARVNLPDPRVRLHWEDARHWRPDEAVDTVVTNPPFHAGRRGADPDLGRAFIAAAAAMLAPHGALWLVANRHLPYEAALSQHFAQAAEVGGNARFKILQGRRPSRHRR